MIAGAPLSTLNSPMPAITSACKELMSLSIHAEAIRARAMIKAVAPEAVRTIRRVCTISREGREKEEDEGEGEDMAEGRE